MLVQDFIGLWLGDEFLLPKIIPLIVCVQFFLFIVREVNDQFIYGYGLFYDVWAPFVEIIIFVASSMGFGSFYGLQGVLMGPLISTFVIVYLWKPYFLFSKGFKKSVLLFWSHFLAYLLVLAIASACAIWLYYQILEFVPIKESWLAWLIHAILFTVLNGLISFALYSVAIKDFRGFWMRLFHYKKGKG
jgi:hypothetical protein